MATLTGDKAAAAVATRSIETGVVVEQASYTTSATLSAGDAIQMVKVPAGARVVDVKTTTNSAAGIAIAVGDGLDENRYVVTASVSALSVLSGNANWSNYEYTADDTIDITYDASMTATTTLTFNLQVMYTLDN